MRRTQRSQAGVPKSGRDRWLGWLILGHKVGEGWAGVDRNRLVIQRARLPHLREVGGNDSGVPWAKLLR